LAWNDPGPLLYGMHGDLRSSLFACLLHPTLGAGIKRLRYPTLEMEYIQEISESDARTAYGVTRRVFEGRTTVGTDVLIADSPTYGRMLFLDGELQSATADEQLYHEALIHPAMAATVAENHNRPLDVLVVGGGEGATVREVVRWPQVEHVMWVDWDDDLVQMCRRDLGWAPSVYAHPRVEYHPSDIRMAWPWLREFDVIVLDLPDPDGETEYLYTDVFWADVFRHLRPGGRVVTHCGPVRPFGGVGEGYQRLQAAAPSGGQFYHTLIPSFQGEWGFMMWGGWPPSNVILPLGLRVADSEQLAAWGSLTQVWRGALSVMEEVAVGATELEE
jgi:spermidine synthase